VGKGQSRMVVGYSARSRIAVFVDPVGGRSQAGGKAQPKGALPVSALDGSAQPGRRPEGLPAGRNRLGR